MALETGSASTTAQAMIKHAYLILGDLEAGENLDSHRASVGLAALNSILDSTGETR